MKQIYLLLATLLLVHVQVFGQSVPSYVPTNGLVGWWGFNGNAQDGSGNGNHGTVNGATLTTDRFGNQNSAYDFDGVNNWIQVQDHVSLRPNHITISAWVNLANLNGGYCIICKTNIQNAIGEQYGIGVDFLSNWKPNFQIKQGSNCQPGYNWQRVNLNTSYSQNNWYHIVCTYDGTTLKIYHNGQFNSTNLALNGVIDNCSGGTLNFGRFWNSQPDFFNGKLDDIGIWNRALSQQEITNLYQICRVSLTTQPSNQTTGTNRNVHLSVVSSDSNSTYRWQSNSGFGFQDLYNAGQYAGVNTSTLNVSNTSPQNDNQLFRCIVSTTNCGSDTSDVVTLNVNSSSTSTGVPNKFTYQSVVRDTSGQLVTNQPVGMRLSLQRGPQMTNLYTETHQLTTNSNGLLTTTIGSGQATLGMMDTIDWSGGMVYVKTEIDMTGGSNYSLVSTRELLSVPYALYSLNSGSSTPGPIGPMGPQGVPGPQGPSGVSIPAGGTSGQALFNCNGVPTWGPCPNQPNMPTVITNPVTLLLGNSASTGGNVTSDGGSPVTHRGVVYDTTSNPSLSSNYTVDGSGTGSFVSTLNNLAPTTTYYTRAYATNSVGTAYGSVVSFSTTLSLPAVSIGQNYAGGIVFYIDQTGQHGLVCAPFDQGVSAWGLNGIDVVGTSPLVGAGALNTSIMVGYGISAATLCDTLVLNGYSDWYLPSLNELSLMDANLFAFGLGNFSHNNDWWSSTQYDSVTSFVQRFWGGQGGIFGQPKTNPGYVRAIRSFNMGTSPNQPTMPTVTTNPVTLLPGNSASTGGNVTSDGGSPVTHRGVVYDTTSNPSLSSNYTVDGSGTGSFVSTLTSLAPTTTYFTRAYATNSVGTAYGGVVSFSTISNTGNVIPPTLFIPSSATSNHISINVGAIFIVQGTNQILNKGFCYSLTSFPDFTYYTSEGPNSNNFSSLIGNLYSDTTYYIRAYAVTAVDTFYSNIINVRTSIPTQLYIGQPYNGGVIFYIDSTGSHGLIASTSDLGRYHWGCLGNIIDSTYTGIGFGEYNSLRISANCYSTPPTAASACLNAVINGYGDWYLPSYDELVLLKSNLYDNGYTQYFGTDEGSYWCSTEISATQAMQVEFYFGGWFVMVPPAKTNQRKVHPIRSF